MEFTFFDCSALFEIERLLSVCRKSPVSTKIGFFFSAMQKTLPSLMSTAVRVTAMTLLYVILLVRCEDEHAFELVVPSVRIPDLRFGPGRAELEGKEKL